MSRPEDQIVFEDLHGVHEDKSVTVDLDADRKDAGIELSPDEQSVDAGAGNDDQIEFDNLRSADNEAEQQDDKDDQASTDSEDDAYSKKVKARIEREARAKRKERQRADSAEARAAYWENQAKDMAKSQYEGEKRDLKRSIEQADSALEQTEVDLEKAIEDGDTKGQVRLTKRLSDLKADKVLAESRLDNLSPDGNVQPFDDKISPEGQKTTQSAADKWMDDRSDWYGSKGFDRQTRLANRLDKEVYKDGFDPNTPEYFEELDRRMKEKEPTLYEDLDAGADDTDTDDTGDDKDTERKQGKNVVAPVGGNETRHQRTSGSKIELTPEDFDTMRQFNLDTNDPEVLKEFARNKAEAEGGRR